MSILSFDVGLKNLAFCILENNTIIDWNVSEIKYSTNQNLCEAIVSHLDKFQGIHNCHTVLIEKQPSRNNKMRIIEALLNAYFVIKGTTNDESKIKKVMVYSAKYKLGSSTVKGKSNYTERKKLAIVRCRKFLENTIATNEKWISQFENSKKKDDLADCLLQALAYAKNSIFDTLQNVCIDNTTMKVIARKPTDKQIKSGKYSRSNIKYLLINNNYNEENCPSKLLNCIKQYYNSIDNAFKILQVFHTDA